MKQKILIAVLGMTPQIITETVYALYHYQKWVPEKIIVLTTQQGKNQITQQLLGEHGYFTRLCQEYDLPPIEFGEHTIKTITQNGEILNDIRTAEQNNATADLIVREIYQHCQNPDTELHVSIAGGRKTMGFYIGYALSLFGRTQDRMSHVLIESDFEQLHAFFYPPKESKLLNTNSGIKDASQAQIMLADIPFVRMTDNTLQFAFDQQLTFSQAVARTQQVLSGEAKLYFDVKKQTVRIGKDVMIKLPPQDFCVYVALAARHQRGESSQLKKESAAEFAQDYFHFYQQIKMEEKGNATQKIAELCQIPEGTKRSNIESIFSEANSHIKKALKKHLGEYGRRFEIQSHGKPNAKIYTLDIDAKLIEISE